jgi:hypothetical protein
VNSGMDWYVDIFPYSSELMYFYFDSMSLDSVRKTSENWFQLSSLLCLLINYNDGGQKANASLNSKHLSG